MPLDDWQFWTVSIAALWGAWQILRQLVPRRGAGTATCGSCATGAAACAKPASGAVSATGSSGELVSLGGGHASPLRRRH